jgi:preprotein translocase subunit SecA
MVLEGKDTREHLLRLMDEILEWYLDNYCSDSNPELWSFESLQGAIRETFGIEPVLSDLRRMGRNELQESLGAQIHRRYDEREALVGRERALFHQRMIMLQIVDSQWKDHLYSLDHLKEGIGLRGYGQRDPLVEYKKESYDMFQALMDRIDEEVLRWTFLYQPIVVPEAGGDAEPDARAPRPRPAAIAAGRAREPALAFAGGRGPARNLSFNDPGASPTAFARAAQPKEAEGGDGPVQTVRREGKKVGRNDPCPCGSGKKYKKCHGA